MIVREYEDHDSGGKADRAQFQAMIADAAQRRFDVLVFWALDRLTRESALETLQHLNRLSSYGVGFRSFTEPYSDSCGIFKDAVVAILGTIAKQERIRISERVRPGLNRARSKGRKVENRSADLGWYSHVRKLKNSERKVARGAKSPGPSA